MAKALDTTRLQEYLLRRIHPRGSFQDLLSFPSFLEVETVNACNARCPMCTIADWERGYTPMTDNLFNKIAAELAEHAHQVERLSLYRDGEPLIDKKLADRVAMVKEGGIKNVSISTNVSLLSETRAKDLLHAGLDNIILSIDSLKKKVFESIRVRLVFEEVMENALRFIDLRNQIRPETQIWIRMIRQEGNRDEWPAFQSYWGQRTGENDRVYYHNIHNWGGQLQGFRPILKSFEPSLPCVALWSLLVIFSNGDVPLCNVDFNNNYPSGSVLTHSIEEVWHSKVMNQRRDWHMAGEKGRIKPCENCNVWDEPTDQAGISSQYTTDIELKIN